MSFIYNLGYSIYASVLNVPINSSWGITEFLINFEGGFVRRGLVGQVLYWLTESTGVNPILVINVICFASLIFVVVFFFKKFHDHNYCWWLLLSPLFLNNTDAFIRKDFLLYSLLIGIFTLLKKSDPSFFRRCSVILLCIVGLFIHEAFIFFSLPIVAIVLLSDKGHRLINSILLLILISAFLMLCYSKGSFEVANEIINSWNAILPDSPLMYQSENSIGALSWDSVEAFIFHFKTNIGTNYRATGIVFVPLQIMIYYYLLTNFLSVFGKNNSFNEESKSILSSLYLVTIVGLIPMFTILSCDFGRVTQYATIAAFASFVIIPNNILRKGLGTWTLCKVRRFNDLLCRFLPPNRGLLLLLLLLVAPSPIGFSLDMAASHSVIGSLTAMLTNMYSIIRMVL